MCRPQKDPLRLLSQEERKMLEQFSCCLTQPADQVIHAKEVFAVADGHTLRQWSQSASDLCRRMGILPQCHLACVYPASQRGHTGKPRTDAGLATTHLMKHIHGPIKQRIEAVRA